MSISDNIHLDLQVIAGLLGSENLDPPSKLTEQNESMLADNTTRPTKEDEGVPAQNVTKREVTPASPKDMRQDKEDFEIPGLEPSSVSASKVPPKDESVSPVEIETDIAVMPTEMATSSPSGGLNEAALNIILAKHNLQMITPESEEDDESTSETDSGDSDSSEDSDSTASSRESSNLPMEGDAGDSDTGTSRLRSQHKKNKARLKKMVQDDAGSEDDLDLPSGTQPLAMFATVHEIIAPQVTMPSITEVPEDEPIVLIGEVMSIVDSVVVVKSMSTGTQRVLDTDSLLVLENRKVLGLVFETFGPLTAPLYSVRFPSSVHFPSAISAFAESPTERPKVYYCPSRSTFAYTSKLLLNRGNDASNLYDEEVAENELEFSDDEAEREWKRQHDKGASGKRKRRSGSKASSRAGSIYAHSPQLGESPTLPYGDEMDGVLSAEGDTSLSYVDPYNDEPVNPTLPSPSTSNGPSNLSLGVSLIDPSPKLPSKPTNNRGSHDRARGRGRGRGQSGFSGGRERGRGRGRVQQPQERGRQSPRGQVPTANMGPPVMTEYNNHAEYNPSYAGNFPPNTGNMSPFMPMGNSGAMHQNGGSVLGAPYMGGMEFHRPLMGMQPPQTFGMQGGPTHPGNGMYGGRPPMHPIGGDPRMSPFMQGLAPGAYVNPRFAVQPPAPGGRGGPPSGFYQHGGNFQPPRHNP